MTAADLIRQHEGLRLKPYRCTAGKLTIGFGRNLDDVGISEAEADVLLRNDLARAAHDLATLAPWTDQLDEVRHAALLDLTLNLGGAGLGKFTRFLAAMQRADWLAAAAELRNSRWWGQVGNRAQTIAGMVVTGRWPAP